MKQLGILFLAGVVLISAGCMRKNRYRLNANNSNVTNGDQTLQPPTCKNTDVRVTPTNLVDNTAEVGESVPFGVTYQSSQLGDLPYCFNQLRFLDSADNQFKPIPVSGVILTKAYTAVAASQTETLQFRFEGGSPFSRGSESFNIVESVRVDLRATYDTVFFERTSGGGGQGIGEIELRPTKAVKLEALESSIDGYVTSTDPSLPRRLEKNTLFKLKINTSKLQGAAPRLTLKYREILSSGQESETVLEQNFDVSHERCKWTMTDSFWGQTNTTLIYNCQTQKLTRVLPSGGEAVVGSLNLPAPNADWKFQILHGRLSSFFTPDLVVYSLKRQSSETQSATWRGEVSLIRLQGDNNPFRNVDYPMGALQLCGEWKNPGSALLGERIPEYLSLIQSSGSQPAQLTYSLSRQPNQRLEASLSDRGGRCLLGPVKETFIDNFNFFSLGSLFGTKSGSFFPANGKLHNTGDGVGLITLDPISSKNGSVEADFVISSEPGYFGLLARHTGIGDGTTYLVQIGRTKDDKYIAFFRSTRGTWKQLIKKSGDFSEGKLRFEVQENLLEAFFNDQPIPILGYPVPNDPTIRISVPGNFGVRASGNVSVDNFKVSAELMELQ